MPILESMTAGRPSCPLVLCLGEALVDRLGPLGGDPESAAGPAGPNPVPDDDRLGGAPANAACALARLGTPSAFVGRLGLDAIGAAFARLFAERGVDTRALQWDAERPSRIVLVRRDASGERVFGGFAGDRGAGFADQALDAKTWSAAHGPLLAQARWLLLGTIPLASPASAQTAWLAVRQAAAAGVAIALDVNWRPTFWNPAADPASGPTAAQVLTMLPLIQQARLLKCAAEEAQWLFGSTDPAVVSAALPQRPLVVVTDGSAPLRWARAPAAITAGQVAAGQGLAAGSLQPFAVPVLDSTGAGDAFTAGLLHGLCATPALLEGADAAALAAVMRSASACGALVCQGTGAIDPQPTAAEVNAWLRSRG